MRKNMSILGILYAILGILSFGYFFILSTFAVKISFSKFWILLGSIFLFVSYLKIKNIDILSNFKGVKKFMKFIVIAAILGFIVVEIPIVYNGVKSYSGKSDYIIVLGAGLRGKTMSPALYERVKKALEYSRKNPETKIIVSGGKGAGESVSEAFAMKEYFVENGVNESIIIEENKSTNTYENLLFSRKKLEEIEKKNIEDLRISVVTNNFHVYRAKFLGKRLGLKLQGIPAEIMPAIKLNFYVREALAVLKSAIFDR
ncbi:YdcF family protein [Haloimpatiens sp. FM7315]|uniref:YdcF family protein n=1 Tax=Haloimpatiens sp. FM7315 TaxID=3298609 RepID=UPI0035A2F9F7